MTDQHPTNEETIQYLQNRLDQLAVAYESACKEILELHKAISYSRAVSEKLTEFLTKNDYLRSNHRPTPVSATGSTVPLDD